jgi:hypothetical protein
MQPRDGRGRRSGQPAASAEPVIGAGTSRIADRDDAGQAPISPEGIVGMLAAWVDVKMGEVDDLVDEARSRVAAIPDQRQLWLLAGETLVRLHALELEVAGLRAEVARLRQKGRAA